MGFFYFDLRLLVYSGGAGCFSTSLAIKAK